MSSSIGLYIRYCRAGPAYIVLAIEASVAA